MVRQRIVKQVFQVQADGSEREVSIESLVTSLGVERSVSAILYLEDDGTGPFPLLDVDISQAPPNPVSIGTLVTLTAVPEGGAGALSYLWTAPPGAPPLSNPTSRTPTITVPAGTPVGMTWTYTVTATDQSYPPRTSSAAVRIGVGSEPPQPTPLKATLGQTPANPVPKGTTVTLRVTPSGGTPSYSYAWSRVSATGPLPAASTGPATTIVIPSTLTAVTTWRYQAIVTDAGGNPQRVTAQIDVTGTPSTTPPTMTWPGLQLPKVIVGLNVDQASAWDSRVASMDGFGKIKARRIFLGSNLPTSGMPAGKEGLIDKAINDGQMPVVSYKVLGMTDSAAVAAATKLKNILVSKGVPLTISLHHEPNGDLTPAEYVRLQKLHMPIFKSPNLIRCPILNGWLSESKWSTLTAFAPDELMAWGQYWECMGSDDYQQGSLTAPSTPWARRRMERMRAWLDSRGYSDWKFLVGETNGYSEASMIDCMEGVYDPLNRIWLACMWDSGGLVLSGARLAAFANALDDPRRY